MKFTIPALCCSCIIGVAAWAGAQDKPAKMDKPMGKEMKVTGCVAAGADADHFMLNDAMPAAKGGEKAMKADMKPMSYTLMGGDLKPHVGHKVEVTGTAAKGKEMAGGHMMNVTAVKMLAPTCS
jgi:hypothetical protein